MLLNRGFISPIIFKGFLIRVFKNNNNNKGDSVALSDIEAVRLRIGDTPESLFYPLLSDEDIEYCLESNHDSVQLTVPFAASCAYARLTQIPVREKVGDVEIWNNVSKEYATFLTMLVKGTGTMGLLGYVAKPYAAGISWADLLANYGNPDVVKSSLALLETGYYNEQEGTI
jgi:hypothetical protein